MFQGGETFIYQYDWIGRATGVILSSGETLELTSKIAADEGLEVTVSKPPTQLTVTGKANKKVIMIDGELFLTIHNTGVSLMWWCMCAVKKTQTI